MPFKENSPQRLETVAWTARMGAITAEALAVREGCTLASSRARLLAAQRAGLLSRARPLADGPALFTVTRRGLRVAGPEGIAPGRVSVVNARHSSETAWAAATLERLYPDHRVMGERELRREEGARGAPIASASMSGAPSFHRPDIVLWPSGQPSALPVAVEVELTVKAPRRLTAICAAWARCRRVAGVLYLASDEVMGPLERAVAAARAQDAVAPVALKMLAPGSSIGANRNERTIPERP